MSKRDTRGFIRLLVDLTRASDFQLDHAQDCPYKGLEAFGETDVDLFFGRDATTSVLVGKVKAKPLVAVTGPSGSGKSSLVAAGLIPMLRSKHATWSIVRFRLGSNPLASLAGSLSRLITPAAKPTEHVEAVPKLVALIEEGKLPQLIEQISGDGRCTLLFIDQFEELYTFCNHHDQRVTFLDRLLDASRLSRPDSFKIVITLRADFINRVYSHRGFTDALQDADLKVGPMTSRELTQVIEGPAALRGVTFEEGLVERIVSDVGNEVGALPLLEFALARIWERRSDTALTHFSYEQVGQLAGAIANSAETLFRNMNQEEQLLTRSILSRLVRVSEPGGDDTRQRVSLLSLYNEAQINSDAGRKVIETLVTARLLVLGRDDTTRKETIEVTHEALIRRWPRFRQWLQEDHDLLVWRQRIDLVIPEWKPSGRDEVFLLRGPLLNEARLWLTQRKDALTAIEQDFIEISKAFHERELRDRPVFTGQLFLRNDLKDIDVAASDQSTATLLDTLRQNKDQEWWSLRFSLARSETPDKQIITEPVVYPSQVRPLLSATRPPKMGDDKLWTPPDVLKGIKLDDASVEHVRELQRQAQTGVAVELLAPNLDAITEPRTRLIYASVLFDMLHIRGSYEQAASLIEQELSLANANIPATDYLLIALRIRLIHHYMFYKPVLPLYEQMESLLRRTNASKNPEAYGEMLFMLGGNLGTLRGRTRASRKLLFDAIRHAVRFNDTYLFCRCLRKYGDFLRERGHLNKSGWLLNKGFEIAKKDQLRHIIYYLGSFGDLERQRRNFADSERLFNTAIDKARESFVPGWLGNLFLGKAALAVDKGNYEEAAILIEQSEAHYQNTRPRHVWGEVQVNICRSRIALLSKNGEWRTFAGSALELANEFGYERDREFAANLLRTATPLQNVLMFL